MSERNCHLRYCQLMGRKSQELAKLVEDSREFMSQIAKAKTAKLSESRSI